MGDLPETRNRSETTMPLYEFKCNKCGHTFDKILSIKEMETVKLNCPKCGSDDIKKLMSSGGVKIGLGGYSGKIR
ncbi:MAG: zinc ribbon domain-containing protein [bacterium]|nr:zinc ribbon domain-containing protein [bacterium]MDT8367354.1 zinc ribbon domain-containing protein [bacterium]